MDESTRRWLHDKYERLSAQESELAANRTSYFAAIGTVLITGLLVALNYFLSDPHLLVLTVSFLAALGILISFVWVVLLRRTQDAQAMWREAAQLLEGLAPPVGGSLTGTVRLRGGGGYPIDLLRPFTTHAERFRSARGVSWTDRVNPDLLTQLLPITFLTIWTIVLAGVWLFSWT